MENVIFRALEPTDIDNIYEWQNDFELMKNAIGMARPWSRQDCMKWLEVKTKHDPFNYWFAICLNDESKKMIGYTGVNNIHYVNSSATCNAIVIGDNKNRDGIAWLETNLFIRQFVFERLHLNRYYGSFLDCQRTTALANKLFFAKIEGVAREAIWNNGNFCDLYTVSMLSREYFMHKNNGEYTLAALIRRLKLLMKEGK